MEKIHPSAKKEPLLDAEMMDHQAADKMIEQVKKNDLVVRDQQGNPISVEKGKDAFFALMAQDLLSIAAKYEKDVDEVHKIYFQVSC